MEQLIRISSVRDREVVNWLCHEVGTQRVMDAAVAIAASGKAKPYPSAVCRYLGLMAPSGSTTHRTDRAIGGHYLSLMKESLHRSRR